MSDHLKNAGTVKTRKWYPESPAAMAFAYILGFFVLTFLVITPTYDTNDDPGMGLVVSGYGCVDGPDEHLLYTNVLTGIVLKKLYEVAPLVPWYGCYLLLAQFVAHWLLLYALLLLNRKFFSILSYALFYAVLGVYFLTHLQFTSTAFLMGMAGLALVLSSVILDSKGTHHPWLKWEGALCLIASSLIRYQSIQMLVLASLPLLLAFLYHFYKCIKLKSYVIPGAIAIIAVVGGHLYDQHYYEQDEDWRRFNQFHAGMTGLVNYAQIPYTDQTKPVFDLVGWSALDYWMLRNWIFLDSDIYSVSRLRKFKEQTDNLKLRKYPQVMRARVQTAKDTFTNPVLLFCCFASIFIACLNQKGRWQRSMVKWLLIWSGLLMIWLIIYLKLPERVFSCLSVMPLYFAMLLNIPDVQLQSGSNFPRWPIVKKVSFMVLLLAACFIFWNQVQRSAQIVRKNLQFKRDIKTLKDKWPDKVILAFGTLELDRFLPLDNQSQIKDLKHLFLGSRQGSPLFQQKLKEYGIQSLYTDLYETDRLLFISHPKMNPLFKAYIKQHYGENIAFQSVLTDAHFQLYKVIREKEAPAKPEIQKKVTTTKLGTKS